MLLATLVAAKLVLAPLQLREVGRDAAAAASYVSNLWFAHKGTDYLANHSPSPVQHYWSLAVEEQFYLVWPLLIVIAGWRARRHRARVTVVVAVISALSLTTSVVVSAARPEVAFFILPTRAWELGAGALVALCGPSLRLNLTAVRLLTWGGLCAIAGAAVLYDESLAFPGWVALLPVLGAVAVIGGGANREAGASAILARRPLQFLGRISYSLYLWHWPLIVIPAMAWGPELEPVARGGLVLAAVALAAVTFHLVENPIRASTWLTAHRGTTYALGGTLTILALLGSLSAARLPRLSTRRDAVALSSADLAGGIPPPSFVPANLTPALGDVESDLPAVYRDGCHADPSVTVPNGCFYGDPNATQTVALFGDSHAAQWFPAVRRLADEFGWRLLSLTKSACPSVDVPIVYALDSRTYSECATWRQNAVKRIADARPSIVFLGNLSSGYRTLLTVGGDFPEQWGQGLRLTLSELPPTARVVVLGDTPKWPEAPNLCLSSHLEDPATCSRPRTALVDAALYTIERTAIEEGGGEFVDTAAWLCADLCHAIAGTTLMYRDESHLTATFAAELEPLLATAVASSLSPR